MTDAAASTPLDGAIAAFLTRVLDELVAQLSAPDVVGRALTDLGLEGADLELVAGYVASRSADVSALQDAVPALVTELGRPKPDLLALVEPMKELFGVATRLGDAAAVPHVDLPGLPDAGSVIETLLAQAVERALQLRAPTGWAFAKALHLVGPEVPVFSVISDVLASPTGYVWRRFQSMRRHLDITITGILTGPRTTSVLTIPVSVSDQVSAEVKAKVPDADVVVGRITLRLAADTYDVPHVFTLEALGHDPGNGDPPHFAALVLMSEAVAAPLQLSSVVTVHLDPFEKPLGLAVTGWGDVIAIADGSPTLTLNSSFAKAFSFGQPGGLRLELSGPVLDPQVSTSGWSLRAGLETFEVSVPADVAGPILELLLPRDGVRLRGKLILAADEKGLHAEGGVGLKTTWPDTLRLPGLLVRRLSTEITTSAGGFTLVAAGTVTVDLGVLTATVEGLGVRQPVEIREHGDGNLGLLHLGSPELNPPTGIGVSIDAGVVSGGGFLRIEEHGVSGALELALKLGAVELTIRAVGVIESVEGRLSFVVVMSVEFSPAIEIFLGLTLNAIGGIFGINRTMDTDALTATVRSGRMSDVMFPHDLAARASEVIAAVKQVFPARADQVVIGPMLKLGWGRPVSFVTVSVGVVFTFPDPVVIAIIGSLRIGLPTPDVPIIDLRADFSGVINASTGDVSFDASLANSRIAAFDLSGDLALRAGPSGFLFTAGGFFPGFPVPSGLGAVRRLAISIAPSSVLSIRAEAYFALTPSTVQFGGGLAVVADLGPIGVRGGLSLDVLIRTQPSLAFTAQMHGSFRLSFEGSDILSARLDVLLEGPGRWHARAHAEISFLCFSVSGTLELSWGESHQEAPPSVLVAEEVRRALDQAPVWAHVIPAQDGGIVTLRDGATALHPLGKLRLTQTVAPLGVALSHFGNASVLDAGPVEVTVTAGFATPEASEELFASAQFFDLTDEEKLSKPAFVAHRAGYTVAGSGWAPLADPLVAEVGYEESTQDQRPPAGERRFRGLDASMIGWSVLGAAGRSNGGRTVVTSRLESLKVNPTQYAVVDAATGAVTEGLGLGLDRAFAASAVRSVDTVALADYELRGLGR